MISGISLWTGAQNKIEINEFQKKDFDKEWQKEIMANINVSLIFQTDTSIKDFKFSQKLPNQYFQFNQPDSLSSFENSPNYQLRMPVAGGGMYFNMPIAVPDSSVHYYLKVKRIPSVNPLEKRNK